MIIGVTPKGVPFIRWLPNGGYVGQTIERTPVIEFMAHRFIANRGRYYIALLPPDEVIVAACVRFRDGTLQEIAREATSNGPPLADAVDKVVRASIHWLDTFH